MKQFIRYWFLLLALLVSSLLAACASEVASTTSSGQQIVRLAYFPNLTHAIALVGVARGTFAQDLGSGVSLQMQTFNAGPALIEALFANEVDIGYVGPNPAINGYVKSHGEALRIIAGASSGGALFVVRPGANIHGPQDLANKKLATPQLGGTQDVALRYYLKQHGLKTADEGGSVQILPTDNANILTLFRQGKIDGAWVPEPWATRLIVEGQGTTLVDERTLWPNQQFVTTNVVVRKAFADQHPELVKKFLQAHIETALYIQQNPENAKILINNQIKQITGKGFTTKELNTAFANLTITYDPLTNTLLQQADRAYALGFLGDSKPDLSGIYQLGDINAVLSAKKLALVSGP
jgi:NitT/TauT family transport system substrate-binding protein